MPHTNINQWYGESVSCEKAKFVGQQSALDVHQFKALTVYQKPRISILQYKIKAQFSITIC